MFDAHVTQKNLLDLFPVDVECFRPPPEYDFTNAPHEGRLFYENHGLGVTGACWRKEARAAMSELLRNGNPSAREPGSG